MPGVNGGKRFGSLSGVRPTVRWVRLGDIAAVTADSYICCRCGEGMELEDAWSCIPYSAQDRQMLQGYIHCNRCRLSVNAVQAWKQAHDADPWTSHKA